ncbi:MAG: NAD(P)H-hydrate dehydratase [Pseudomonadota bacterium]
MCVLLSPSEMTRADALAVTMGVDSYGLMLRAGAAVADAAVRLANGRPVHVLCGPGNNGGDGFVAAEVLRRQGVRVSLAAVSDAAVLHGDAAKAAADWQGPILPISAWLDAEAVRPVSDCVVIDALFGAGLARPLTGDAAEAVTRVLERGWPVVAVDVPSGLDGGSGQADGPVFQATETVTFFRLKPGHLLLPGRACCGSVTLADIGIPEQVLGEIGCRTYENGASLWGRALCDRLPCADQISDRHKYNRGHAVVVSGPRFRTGAARLAANAALRAGAGLVTLTGSTEALREHAAHVTAIMLRKAQNKDELAAFVDDPRITAALFGPAAGLGRKTRDVTLALLEAQSAVVLDADALTVFTDRPDQLFNAVTRHGDVARAFVAQPGQISGTRVVLTPHEGEFARLFGDINDQGTGKLGRARAAAARSGAVVLLKGSDTVIAHPDGRAAINAHASPWLATAGSGDVLAGIVTGLLACGMPAFEAACCAVWLHGEAGLRFGPALTADDLPGLVPAAFAAALETLTVT